MRDFGVELVPVCCNRAATVAGVTPVLDNIDDITTCRFS